MKIGVAGNGMIANMFLNDAKEVEGADIISICVRPQSLKKERRSPKPTGFLMLRPIMKRF